MNWNRTAGAIALALLWPMLAVIPAQADEPTPDTGRLSGTVTLSSGEAAAGVTVTLVRFDPLTGSRDTQVRADGQGRWQADYISPGIYIICAHDEVARMQQCVGGPAIADARRIHVKAGSAQEADLAFKTTGKATGRVMNPQTNEPVARQEVVIQRFARDRNGIWGYWPAELAFTDSTGRFSVDRLGTGVLKVCIMRHHILLEPTVCAGDPPPPLHVWKGPVVRTDFATTVDVGDLYLDLPTQRFVLEGARSVKGRDVRVGDWISSPGTWVPTPSYSFLGWSEGVDGTMTTFARGFRVPERAWGRPICIYRQAQLPDVISTNTHECTRTVRKSRPARVLDRGRIVVNQRTGMAKILGVDYQARHRMSKRYHWYFRGALLRQQGMSRLPLHSIPGWRQGGRLTVRVELHRYTYKSARWKVNYRVPSSH